MTRAVLILNGPQNRIKARKWVDTAPAGTRVEFKKPRRTIPQNDRMWAMLTDVAAQKEWHGVRLSPDDWKIVFMSGLERELRIVPNLEGDGFVNLGGRSSELSKEEMSMLIDLIDVWGAENGVVFTDEERAA